ncbi:MAG: hypothetical protein ACM3U0_01825 [archaeon]
MKPLILLIVLSLTSVCFAQSKSPQEIIGMEMQNFFLHPSSDLVIDIIKSIDADKNFLNGSSSIILYTGFMTAAFAKYADKYEEFYNLSNGLNGSKELAQYCLKLSKIQDAVLNWAGHDPGINDLLWSGFFASGDTKYLDRLVSEMKYCERKDSLNLFLTGISAKWSLCANAISYSLVKEHLKQTLDKRPPELQAHLKELLNTTPDVITEQMREGIREFKKSEKVNSANALCAQRDYNSNGLQIHFVLIKDKNFFEEWKKPEMPVITTVDTYKRGEDVIPIILFSTDGKDVNGNADLTYDITITKPDGTIYGHFEQLKVWKDEPAPMMHLVKQPVIIHLEENDPAGIYKINSVIYENNKKTKAYFELAFQVAE